jgi:hypothetical protein
VGFTWSSLPSGQASKSPRPACRVNNVPCMSSIVIAMLRERTLFSSMSFVSLLIRARRPSIVRIGFDICQIPAPRSKPQCRYWRRQRSKANVVSNSGVTLPSPGWPERNVPPGCPPKGRSLARLLLVKQVNQADNCGDDKDSTHRPPKNGTPSASPLAPRGMARWFTTVARHNEQDAPTTGEYNTESQCLPAPAGAELQDRLRSFRH